MGYDLHITRREDWSGKGEDITSDEWLSLVASDPDLRLEPANGPLFAIWSGGSTHSPSWLDWSDGQVSAKNPDDALIDKMVAIAGKLGAVVQGDDGELYRGSRDAHKRPRQPPLLSVWLSLGRCETWLAKWFYRPKSPAPPFRVGDRVIDAARQRATVTAIDRRAERGHGTVRVRYDDGREATYLLSASGLSPSPEQGNT